MHAGRLRLGVQPDDRRVQIEEPAVAFIGRQDNLVIVGQSGVGNSRIVQAVGRAACVVGYRVCYTTSADLLAKLTASWPIRPYRGVCSVMPGLTC